MKNSKSIILIQSKILIFEKFPCPRQIGYFLQAAKNRSIGKTSKGDLIDIKAFNWFLKCAMLFVREFELSQI